MVVDYYSNNPEVYAIGNQVPTSSQVISNLKSVFSRHGSPRTLYRTIVLNLQVRTLNSFSKIVKYGMTMLLLDIQKLMA